MAWSTLDLGGGYGHLSVATLSHKKNDGVWEFSDLPSGVAIFDANNVVSSFHLHLAAHTAAYRRDKRTLRYKEVHQELMMMLSESRSKKKGMKNVSGWEGSNLGENWNEECGHFFILASFDLDCEGRDQISGN